MTSSSSEDDRRANKASIIPATNGRQPSGTSDRTKSATIQKKPVQNADTMFGGRLLLEVQRVLQQEPLPLTKPQLVEKCMADVEQVLLDYPDLPIKVIIKALASLNPDTDGPAFQRALAAAVRLRKAEIRPPNGTRRYNSKNTADGSAAVETSVPQAAGPSTPQGANQFPASDILGDGARAGGGAPTLFDDRENGEQ